MPNLGTSFSPLFFALLLAACAAPAAQGPVPGVTPPPGALATPPTVVGASAEGTLERRPASDGARATHLLKGPKGEVLYALENVPPLAYPELELARHEGQRVNVTGSLRGQVDGVPLLAVGSVVVLGGGEFDRVIASISRFRCAGVTFAESDVYRLDALHSVGEARFPVHVQTGAGNTYTVWMLRRPDLPAGYAVDRVLRSEGKVLVPACGNGG